VSGPESLTAFRFTKNKQNAAFIFLNMPKQTVVMNNLKLRTKILGAVLPTLLAAGLSSCENWVYEDLDPCTMTYRLKFRYDYNMKFADAFPAEVKSINVWAFDSEGKPVWKGEASGDALGEDDFSMTIDVAPGTYSFLAWGGLADSEAFTVEHASAPSSVQDLGCRLNLRDTRADASGLYSDHEMRGLYHGTINNVTLTSRNDKNTVQEVTIQMMKDTNRIAVMLQHINNTPIQEGDFSVSIEADNSLLSWDNNVIPGPKFSYLPWSTSYGQITPGTPEGDADGTQTTVATYLSELTTSRIMADSNHRLKVVRNTDGKTIINIPLAQYLLLVKGNYHRNLSDQEYLDRQDDYSIVFFLNDDKSWYSAIGIYINSWVIVPPQEEDNI